MQTFHNGKVVDLVRIERYGRVVACEMHCEGVTWYTVEAGDEDGQIIHEESATSWEDATQKAWVFARRLYAK